MFVTRLNLNPRLNLNSRGVGCRLNSIRPLRVSGRLFCSRNTSLVDLKEKVQESPNIFSKGKYLKRLVLLAKPEVKLLTISFVALGVSSASTLLFPYVIGGIVDLLASPDASQQLNNMSLGLIVIFGIGSIASFIRMLSISIAGDRIVKKLRAQLFSHILHQQIPFFDSRQTGELVNRLSTDVTIMSKGFVDNISRGISQIISGIGALAMLTYLSPKLAALILVVVPPIAVGAVFYGRKIRILSRQSMDALSETTSIAQECISAIRTLKVFAQEKNEALRYEKLVQNVFQLSKVAAIWHSIWMAGVYYVANLALVVVLYFGAYQVMEGAITSGELASFLFYTLYVGIAFSSLSSFLADLMKTLGSSEQVFELLDRETIADPHKTLPTIIGKVEFQNVSFSYPTRPSHTVLHSLHLTVEPGKCLALVGQSGCGKSTIAHLLCKFYKPDLGTIYIDNVDISTLSSNWLRNQIAIVQQDVVLFLGTIFDNIIYGKPNATIEEVHEAAKIANAHHFIEKFALGYDTQVGEKGVQLSGGQKQRIGIARAIIKNPSILILDEATSALDVENEQLVQEAIQRLMTRCTLLLIAHRLSTIKNANTIAVLKNGHLHECGNFDELMTKKDGLFRQLVEKQLDG